MKHDVHHFYIFKKSYKQENYLSENLIYIILHIFKQWLPITYNKLS